jgi:hypothetical protein
MLNATGAFRIFVEQPDRQTAARPRIR